MNVKTSDMMMAPVLKLYPAPDLQVGKSAGTTAGETADVAPQPLAPALEPISASGKFLWQGNRKWRLRGVTYGPFTPRADGLPWPQPEQLSADLDQIQSLGFNTIRCYELPAPELLEGCLQRGLRLLVGVPWAQHLDFLVQRRWAEDAERRVRQAVGDLGGHPAVLGFLVGNEIPAAMVRWLGPRRVERFLEHLIGVARSCSSDALLAYATYPSTEYLQPGGADFLAVNLYLNEPEALTAYLRRLQIGAGDLPLVVSEFGIDSLQQGEAKQAEAVRWLEDAVREQAVAGSVWFSFTDEWHRGGQCVTGWNFGLVTRGRAVRAAAEQSRDIHANRSGQADWQLPQSALTNLPRMSVIVCSYNGHATLPMALESLLRLDYPDYQILVVDDGSEPSLEPIVHACGKDRITYVRQSRGGLGRARNIGAAQSDGEVLVYTDDDCRADPHWLRYLAAALADEGVCAVGGPNIPPSPRGDTERRVTAAPGGPSHVMLDDHKAEHLPGCNLAVRRSAFDAVAGFSERYWVAGDDVDFCWRLQDAGGRLGFAPAAMVWHHRRMTVNAFLRQQAGYGRAEALLALEHPKRFCGGRACWRGTVYGGGRAHSVASVWRPRVYHGEYGMGPFQTLAGGSWPWWPGQGLMSLGLAGLFGLMAWWLHPLFLLAVVLQLAWSGHHAWRQALVNAHEGGGFDGPDRVAVALLTWLQPLVRDRARLRGLLFGVRWNRLTPVNPAALSRLLPMGRSSLRQWWMPEWRDPLPELAKVVEQEGGQIVRVDDDCSRIDLRWNHSNQLAVTASHVMEPHQDGAAVLRLRLSWWITAKAMLPGVIATLLAGLGVMLNILGAVPAAVLALIGCAIGLAPGWIQRRRLLGRIGDRADALGWRDVP